MNQLLQPATADVLIGRLQKVTPNTAPQWGRMNAAQMVTHCQGPFHVYFGELKLKQALIGKLFGRIAKKKLMSEKPWSKGLPTAKEFLVADERNFEVEKEKLIQQINRFISGSQATLPVHPFFGKMTADEWARLAYKHLDHHLQQFGV